MNTRAVYKKTSDAASEPLTLPELKQHLRVSHDDEDDLITAYGKAARLWCEEYTRRSFINSTWTLTMDSFGGLGSDEDIDVSTIWIERCNLQSVTSITYYDEGGTQQTLSSARYIVDTSGAPGRITPAYGYYWPGVQERINAVTVTFVAGYGAAASSVPESVKAAIKIQTAHLYENRESVISGTIIASVPMSVESLLWSERWSVK